MKYLIWLLLVSSTLAQLSPGSQADIDYIPGPSTAENWSGVWNPLACSKTPAPDWCSGSDIGAWINAAITHGAARIFVPAGSYSQTSTIQLPRNVILSGASAFQTRITYTPASGWAVIASDGYGPGIFAGRGGIEDLSFYGPAGLTNAFANQTGGIYFGGSDRMTGGTGSASVSNCTVRGGGFNTSWRAWQPIILNGVTQLIASVTSSTSLTLVPTSSGGNCPSASSGTWYVTGSPALTDDPSDNFGANYGLNRVRLWGFGVAAQWGRKAWLQQFQQAAIGMNGTGVYLPSSIGGTSGENISFSGGIIGNNGQGVVLNRAGTPTDTDLHFFGVSFDYNIGWQIANGDSAATINFTSSHMEAPAQWIATYGHLYATDSMFTNGSRSDTLGYLIDNGSRFSSISNTVLSNGGSGTTFNPSGS
jgi:Pectate lyase superfamily protein